MTSSEKPPPGLIPYASHVSHGTGRTPVGIILFASSHLLLGAVLAYIVPGLVSRVGSNNQLGPKLFAATVALASLSMIVGGAALLMKGRGAWLLAVTAFTWLAACETIAAAAGVFEWHNIHAVSSAPLFRAGSGLAALGTALFALCVIVLRYLRSAKARDTFALPRGETPWGLRWLPRIAIATFLAAVLLGRHVGIALAP